MIIARNHLPSLSLVFAAIAASPCPGHGTVESPISRVYRVYQSNPQNPSFPLAANAVAIDGTLSYYTWNELSRNIPQAVQAGLPPGFDYSPWIPDGQLASAGRVDPNSPLYPRTYAGLDQVSANWPTTPVGAGQTITVSFLATAAHNPSVWDVWMTTPDWDASTSLRWSHMEFLGRPTVAFSGTHYTFSLQIPANRSGHHVLWIAWQRNDPAGEVFISTSDIDVRPANDECQGALGIGTGHNGTFSAAHATPSPETASCELGGGGADVWFAYTATCSGTLRADTCSPNGNFDSVVSIWSGACGSLTEIGCNDNGCGLLSAATAGVTVGQRYYIKVAARSGSPPGEFDLTASFANATGSFSTSTSGCGAANILATGAPNIGGIVDYAVTGGTGAVQALLMGARPLALSQCAGCTLGTDALVTLPGRVSILIPCNPSLIGSAWYVQGVDAFGTTGGCNLGGGVDFTLTDTIRTQVGG